MPLSQELSALGVHWMQAASEAADAGVEQPLTGVELGAQVVGQPNEFDVELLGDCDGVVSEICGKLGWEEQGIPTTQSSIKLSSEILCTPALPQAHPAAHSDQGAGEAGASAHAHASPQAAAAERTLAEDEFGEDATGAGPPSGLRAAGPLREESLLQEAVASGCVVNHGACTYLFR